MYIALITLHIILCVVLIVTILLQAGKGGGLTEMFGGETAQSVLGTQAPALLKKIRRGTIREFSAYESYQLDHLKVRMPYADWIHLDGDPCKADGVLEFSVLKDKLKIMVPIK